MKKTSLKKAIVLGGIAAIFLIVVVVSYIANQRNKSYRSRASYHPGCCGCHMKANAATGACDVADASCTEGCPDCNAKTFKGAVVAPVIVKPEADMTVKCDYGADIDCVSVTGGGLTNCTYRYLEGTSAVFACKAPKNAGTYTSIQCVTSAGTAQKCCAGSNPVGPYTVFTANPHYQQRMKLPKGPYLLSAKVHSVISKGVGTAVNLICAESTCSAGCPAGEATCVTGQKYAENDVIASIAFPESGEFVNKSSSIIIPEDGNNKNYAVQIVVADGSEALIDNVHLMGGTTDYIVNGEFANIAPGTASYNQPDAWGVGNNQLGFYYGMLANTIPSLFPPAPPPVVPPGSSSSAPGGGPIGNVTVSLKVKLQGVTKKPNKSDPIKVKVKLGGSQLPEATAYQTATLSVSDDGVWSGDATFNSVPTGAGFIVYVKGPKHLQKKICDTSPSEGSGGTYHCSTGKITLQAGANTLDFSKILLLVGDLPESNGNQNGIVDSYDTSFIRQNLSSTDPSKLAIGDLNYDGIIDGQDFSLVLASLSIKYDEE